MLGWTRKSIEYLLLEKLQRLDRRSSWARTTVPARSRPGLGPRWSTTRPGASTKVTDYLLRHTRLIPRDVVSLGNAICAEIVRQRRPAGGAVPGRPARVVSRSSKRYGDSQLAQANNQIATRTDVPSGAASHGYTEVYTSTVEYLAGIDQQLREIIRFVGVDRFTRRGLDGMQDQASRAFDSTTNPTVGAVAERAARLRRAGRRSLFCSQADIDQFDIPMDADHYVFHPNMIDSVRIRGIEDPVYPFRHS